MHSKNHTTRPDDSNNEPSSLITHNSVKLTKLKKSFRLSNRLTKPKKEDQKLEINLTVPKKPVLKKNKSTKISSLIKSPKFSSPKFQINLPATKLHKSHSKVVTNSNRSLKYSLSPKSSCCDLKEIEFPIKPTLALALFNKDLTQFESSEILRYQEIFYLGTITNKLPGNIKAENFGFDDPNSDYLLVKKDHISYRYEIISLLGRGSFGQVCECFDHKKKEKVAIKVIKNKRKFHQQAKVEIRILQSMRENDPEDNKNIIKMQNFFMFRNHVCIVFELISISLYEFLQLNDFKGISLGLIRCFAKQVLTALAYTKSLGVVHCDLKPENILLVNPQKSRIKLIDFGSSCFLEERLHTYIQSRFYRAPEVILGIPYTPAIDMWSLGCILIELFLGQPIWPGENEFDQLLLIISYLGLPPSELLQISTRKSLFFEGQTLRKAKRPNGASISPNQFNLESHLQNSDPNFQSFILSCLQWDPTTRLTPLEALTHPWISPTKIKLHSQN